MSEPLDGERQTVASFDDRFPAEQFLRPRDIRTPQLWIVRRAFDVADRTGTAGDLDNLPRDVQHADFDRVAEIDRIADVAGQEPKQSLDLVADETEAARLAAVAVNGDRLIG